MSRPFEGVKGESDFSVGSDEHDTPRSFVEPIAQIVGGFDIDPAASETSNLADRNLTKADDGLSNEWPGTVWLNPPYSEVETWIERAKSQYADGPADSVIALVFARTGTKWFHEHAITADLICFIQGRLRFGDGEYSAPAPSMVLVWGEAARNFELVEHLASIGILCRPEFGSFTTQTILWGYTEAADGGGDP